MLKRLLSFFGVTKRIDYPLVAECRCAEIESHTRERCDFVSTLESDERVLFCSIIHHLAEQIDFNGHDIEIDDEIRFVVLAQAARLALRIPYDVYRELKTIHIWPRAKDGEGVFILGQAHHYGSISLSWNAVKHGLYNSSDGRNTALHEFAHAIDQQGSPADGLPPSDQINDTYAFCRASAKYFFALQNDAKGLPLRKYGATNEAEFFAVATEALFEKPEQLKRKAPELYRALAEFYCIEIQDQL